MYEYTRLYPINLKINFKDYKPTTKIIRHIFNVNPDAHDTKINTFTFYKGICGGGGGGGGGGGNSTLEAKESF